MNLKIFGMDGNNVTTEINIVDSYYSFPKPLANKPDRKQYKNKESQIISN